MAVDSGGQKLLLPLLLLLPAATVAQNPYCDISTSHTMCQVSLNFVINFFLKKSHFWTGKGVCCFSLKFFQFDGLSTTCGTPSSRGFNESEIRTLVRRPFFTLAWFEVSLPNFALLQRL